MRVRDGQIVESFTSFVNPGRILPAHITELTGILQEQVDEAETMESVLPAVPVVEPRRLILFIDLPFWRVVRLSPNERS